MKRQEMLNLIIDAHEEYGPTNMSLAEKCEFILRRLENEGVIRPDDEYRREEEKPSYKGVF